MYKTVSNKCAVSLTSKLIGHTLKECRNSGLPVVKIFSEKQKGKTFGERITNALEYAFSLGYNNIIVSGTDAPSVNRAQFRQINFLLETDDLVTAPAKDGGVCLFGIKKEAFKRESFLLLPWLTAHLHQSLSVYAREHHLAFSDIPGGLDVDDLSDVLKICTKVNSWFSSLIKSLFDENNFQILPSASLYPPAEILTCQVLRGPPVHF